MSAGTEKSSGTSRRRRRGAHRAVQLRCTADRQLLSRLRAEALRTGARVHLDQGGSALGRGLRGGRGGWLLSRAEPRCLTWGRSSQLAPAPHDGAGGDDAQRADRPVLRAPDREPGQPRAAQARVAPDAGRHRGDARAAGRADVGDHRPGSARDELRVAREPGDALRRPDRDADHARAHRQPDRGAAPTRSRPSRGSPPASSARCASPTSSSGPISFSSPRGPTSWTSWPIRAARS